MRIAVPAVLLPLSLLLSMFACAEGYAPQIEEAAGPLTGAAGTPAGQTTQTPQLPTPGVGACTVGQTATCTCIDGASGTQSCQPTGAFGACTCTPATGNNGSTTAPTNTGCNVDPSLCTGALECCKPDGTCGTGIPTLCL